MAVRGADSGVAKISRGTLKAENLWEKGYVLEIVGLEKMNRYL